MLLTVCFLYAGCVYAESAETEADISGAEDVTIETEAKNSHDLIAIISAMDNEIELLLEHADIDHEDQFGNKTYHVGTLCGKPVIIVRAGIGKIDAAAGVATLLNMYQPSDVIFTGIAGGVGDSTKVLDLVVATDLVQHDYGVMTNDGFQWSGATIGGRKYYMCDPELVNLAHDNAVQILGKEHVFEGTIATGDQFISSEDYVRTLQEDFGAIACEMEGAAIGKICMEYEVPFVVIRSMSDKADGKAHETYTNMGDIAADNSCLIVMGMLEDMAAEEAASDIPDGQPVEAAETEEALTEAEAVEEKAA